MKHWGTRALRRARQKHVYAGKLREFDTWSFGIPIDLARALPKDVEYDVFDDNGAVIFKPRLKDRR